MQEQRFGPDPDCDERRTGGMPDALGAPPARPAPQRSSGFYLLLGFAVLLSISVPLSCTFGFKRFIRWGMKHDLQMYQTAVEGSALPASTSVALLGQFDACRELIDQNRMNFDHWLETDQKVSPLIRDRRVTPDEAATIDTVMRELLDKYRR